MNIRLRRTAVIILAGLCLSVWFTPARAQNPNPASAVRIFAGTTPADPSVRVLLGIPTGAEAEIVEWKLTLHTAESRYDLQVRFGMTAPNHPGIARAAQTRARQGRWARTRGTPSNPDASVYSLDNVRAFVEIDSVLLHVINADGSFMAGNGGWSYTLNRTDRAEPHVDPALTAAGPDGSYAISPPASGPSVLGIFSGRTPCQGIAHELGIAVHRGCARLKWRLTLFRDAQTREPTRYRVEGTLTGSRAREGTWTITHGTPSNPSAVVYRLAPTSDQKALAFLKGDDNTLFFLDGNGRALVGNDAFSYTLDRAMSR